MINQSETQLPPRFRKKKAEKTDPIKTQYPSPITDDCERLTDQEKMQTIATHFRVIMETLGLDLNDPSLAKTPDRVAKMYVQEIFSGLDSNNFPPISFIPDNYTHEGRANIVKSVVKFSSCCEHHFVPMNGTATVAYIPNGKLIGLSKIPRVVRFFARRPQVQERLGAQIADSLSLLLETDDIAVAITATHHCVTARGVEDENGMTTTYVLRGAFENDPARREEFFQQ